MKIRFSFFVALSATLVAGCAAYYSVFGLSQLFAGASLAVIIMASSLEFSKVMVVSILQRYWTKLSQSLKVYLCIGVFILVCITSAGIYGFLSNAYQKTASNLELIDAGINTLNNRKQFFEKNVGDNQTIIKTKTDRITQLSNLRIQQENRVDGATSNLNQTKARNDINVATNEIRLLTANIDSLTIKNSILSDSINTYSNQILIVKSKSGLTSEIGPLKYLAQLTGYSMDKIINWFILILIFVFDPLAVALVLATNKILQLEKEDKKTLLDTDSIHSTETPNIEAESIIEDNIEPPPQQKISKHEPVIPTGKVELNQIKEKREETNRGFSKNIPNNTIQRI